MIHVYTLSYLLTDYIKQSLTSILDNASEPICLTIVDNKSDKSEELFNFIKPLIDKGQVKRYIQLKENVQIMALNQALLLYPPDNSESFFMLTELDIVVKQFDWITETRKMMKDGYILSGFRLSLENYVLPNGGHLDDGVSCGFWLMALKTNLFKKWIPLDTALMDNKVRWVMMSFGKMKQNQNTVLHLAWNAHLDYPEYFEKKKRLGNGTEKWNKYNTSEIEFIYEKS